VSGFVEVLPPERTGPEHPEWFEARRAGVTASEIAAVMGLAPGQWSSAFKIYWQKEGSLAPDPDEPRKRWGRRLERHLADEFVDRHPDLAVGSAGLYAHAERPWQMASPDRLVYEREHHIISLDGRITVEAAPWDYPRDLERDEYSAPVAALECKAWHSWEQWGTEGTDEVPIHIRCQAIWQADVLGVPVVHIPVANGPDYREYAVDWDEADAKLMRAAAEEFLDRLRSGRPPDVDSTPATIGALKRLHPDLDDTEARVPDGLAAAFRRAHRAAKKAEDRKRKIEAQMRQRMQRAKYAVAPDGERVAVRSVYDVKEHVRKASTVDKLVPAREKSR
jgi:putative phage-type endonuclease